MKREGFLVLLLFGAMWLASGCGARQEPPVVKVTPERLEQVYVVQSDSVQERLREPRRGVPAPDFAFEDATGNVYWLSAFRGRPVLLNFWATWCPPCRAEMPALAAAYRAHREAGLVFLAVNEMEDQVQVERFLAQLGVDVPVLLDKDGLVGRSYLVMGLPTTFFLDREGRIALRWTGMLREEDLARYLPTILQEP